MASHYKTLGIPNFSSSKVIQKAFRRLAIQYHPDKHGGNKVYEEKFKEINAAYQILSDSRKKAIYDERLLYGTRSYAETSKSTNKTKASPKSDSRESRQHYKRESRPEPKLKYSPFQKVYIKVSVGLVSLFALICVLSLSFQERINHGEKLIIDYQGLMNRIELSILSKDFYLMEKQVDSLKLYSKQGYNYQVFISALCSESGAHAKQLFDSNEFSESIIYHEFHHRVCTKYGVEEGQGSKVRKIELYLDAGNFQAANKITKEILREGLSEVMTGVILSNVLLRYKQYQLGEEVVSTAVENLLNALSGRYGALYLDVMEDRNLDDRIINAFVQYVCLNRNFAKRERSVLEDFTIGILNSESKKESYKVIQSYNFDREIISKIEINDDLIVFLKDLNLLTFYKN